MSRDVHALGYLLDPHQPPVVVPSRRLRRGTKATNMRGRARGKRLRLRKLQRQARRNQR
jgi:hypothetical protein